MFSLKPPHLWFEDKARKKLLERVRTNVYSRPKKSFGEMPPPKHDEILKHYPEAKIIFRIPREKVQKQEPAKPAQKAVPAVRRKKAKVVRKYGFIFQRVPWAVYAAVFFMAFVLLIAGYLFGTARVGIGPSGLGADKYTVKARSNEDPFYRDIERRLGEIDALLDQFRSELEVR